MGNKGIAITEGKGVRFDICRLNIHSKIKSCAYRRILQMIFTIFLCVILVGGFRLKIFFVRINFHVINLT